MISKNKDCILLSVFCNLDEKFAQSLFHLAFASLIGFVLESLSLSLSQLLCLFGCLESVGGYICVFEYLASN